MPIPHPQLALSALAITFTAACAAAQIEPLWTETSPISNRINNQFADRLATGDINADGLPDFVTSDTNANGEAGAIYVYSGNDQSILWTFHGQPGDKLGHAIACGDIDGDGYDDIAAATRRTSPALINHVRVFSGRTGAQIRYVTGSISDSFGNSVCIANYNGDAFGDLVVGAPNDLRTNSSGRVDVHYGPTLGGTATFLGAPSEALGSRVTNVGDLDGNGTEDIAMAAPSYSSATAARCGRILLRGRNGLAHKSLGTLVGLFTNDALSNCKTVGDVDGDGLVDLGVGNFAAQRNGLNSAGFLLVFSRSGAPRTSTQWGVVRHLTGQEPAATLARSFCGLGDADGDGYDDLALYRYGKITPTGGNRQRLEIVSGLTGATLGSWTHAIFSTSSTLVAADHHGDGLPGFVFGYQLELTAYGWPQGYALPGTNDDLVLRSGLQGLTPDRNDEKTASPGQALGVHVRSPEGAYDQELTLVVAQILGRNQTPSGVPGFPGLQLQATAPVHSLYNPLGNPFGSPILGPSGIHVNLTIASALLGFDMVIQGVAFTPSTASPGAPLSCTEAHRIQVQ
ncbi:MAG: FG-GAP repeat protein [bacterium]|nr:FG-GAP repeat protein [bacterium]